MGGPITFVETAQRVKALNHLQCINASADRSARYQTNSVVSKPLTAQKPAQPATSECHDSHWHQLATFGQTAVFQT